MYIIAHLFYNSYSTLANKIEAEIDSELLTHHLFKVFTTVLTPALTDSPCQKNILVMVKYAYDRLFRK